MFKFEIKREKSEYKFITFLKNKFKLIFADVYYEYIHNVKIYIACFLKISQDALNFLMK